MPLVSIIMPIRNEEVFIEKCLSAVTAQDYPADRIEILVADGMSEDKTREIVRLFQGRHSNIQLIDNPKKTAAAGLNAAIRKAKGEVIIRVDGHCEIAPDSVSQCVRHLRENDVAGVGGPIETVGETFVACAIAIAMSSTFGVGGVVFRTVSPSPYPLPLGAREKGEGKEVDTIAFPAYKRAAVEKAGEFDEELVRNQDDEYNYRLRSMGIKLMLFPDIQSRYYSRSSLGSLWRQYFEYGFWKVRVMQKHPRQMRPRQFVPPLFAAALLASILVSRLVPALKPAFILIVVSYICANLITSLWVCVKNGWKYFLLLPLAYATLHVSYGLGFMTGLVKFADQWFDNRRL